jgi:hypothetical protein
MMGRVHIKKDEKVIYPVKNSTMEDAMPIMTDFCIPAS